METSLPSFSFSRCVSLISLTPLAPSCPLPASDMRESPTPFPEAFCRPPRPPAFSVPISLPLCAAPCALLPLSSSHSLFSSPSLCLSPFLRGLSVSLYANVRNDGRCLQLCALTTSAGQRGSRAARSLLLFEIKAIRIALASPSHLRLTSVKFLAR